MAGTLVMLFQAGLQMLGADLSRQQAKLQRNAQHDALAVGAIAGHEHRPRRQPGVLLDLRYVLVRQLQAIQL
ncbi:hypothetical protein D3C72_2207140 [compost metagenome]